MRDYKLDDLIDEGMMMELTEQAFGENRDAGSRRRRHCRRTWQRCGVFAACAAFVLVLANFDSVMAAARNFITYIVGQGKETLEGLNVYEVLEGPVAFENSSNYFVDLAYRKNDVLYFSISRVNVEEEFLDMLEVEIDGRRYVCEQAGVQSAVSMDTDTGKKTSRDVSQYILTDAPEGRRMTLYVDGLHTSIELKAPSGYAEDTVRTLDAGWVQTSFIPLSPNGQILGYTSHVQDEILKAAYIYFFDTRFVSQTGEEIEAEYIGGEDEFSHELVAVDAGDMVMRAFSAQQIRYRLGGWPEAKLGEYTFTVPERGETVNVDEDLEIAGIRLHLKSIERSELDHISLSFETETNKGDLTWITLEGEGSSGYSGGVGDDVTAALNYSYYVVKEGEEDELVRTFPFKTGDEMTVYFQTIEGAMDQDIYIQWEN